MRLITCAYGIAIISTSIIHLCILIYNQHICIVHPYTGFLSTGLAVSVNRSKSITRSDEKSKRSDVLYMYVLIIPTAHVCLLFSTAIPISLFDFKQLFFILVVLLECET